MGPQTILILIMSDLMKWFPLMIEAISGICLWSLFMEIRLMTLNALSVKVLTVLDRSPVKDSLPVCSGSSELIKAPVPCRSSAWPARFLIRLSLIELNLVSLPGRGHHAIRYLSSPRESNKHDFRRDRPVHRLPRAAQQRLCSRFLACFSTRFLRWTASSPVFMMNFFMDFECQDI